MIGLYNYWIVIFLMMTGFYIVIARENLIKTIIGLNIFQTSVFLLYITMGKVTGGTAPIIQPGNGGESHGGHDDHHGPTEHGPGEHGETLDHAKEHADSGASTGDHLVQSVGHNDDPATATDTVQHAVGHTTESAAGIDVASVVDAAHPTVYHGVSYSNPLPSVLMLTAIVVGIATTALALALIVRIREEYGTIEEDEILLIDQEDEEVS